MGLSGMMMGEGGNAAVRDWIGNGIRMLGDLIEREEGEAGERADLVIEVLVSVLRLPSMEMATNSNFGDRMYYALRYCRSRNWKLRCRHQSRS